MKVTKLTHQLKLYLASQGFKPDEWYIEGETPEYYMIISKIGRRKLILKSKM